MSSTFLVSFAIRGKNWIPVATFNHLFFAFTFSLPTALRGLPVSLLLGLFVLLVSLLKLPFGLLVLLGLVFVLSAPTSPSAGAVWHLARIFLRLFSAVSFS